MKDLFPLRLVAPLLIAVALLAAGCSGGGDTDGDAAPSEQSLAETMITGDLATGVGLGPLAPSCNDPGVYAADTAFTCTALTGPGDVINVHGSVNGEGHLNLATTNVISAAAIPSYEREVAALLNNSVGANLTAEAVDCGSTAIVLPGDLVTTCALIMPASGQIFDVTLSITDVEGRKFSLRVADEPRNLELDPNPELVPPDQGVDG